MATLLVAHLVESDVAPCAAGTPEAIEKFERLLGITKPSADLPSDYNEVLN